MKDTIQITASTLSDYPVIQNMARFYVYDVTRECGFLSKDWAMPEDGLYQFFDIKPYFEDNSRRVYLVRVNDELAGFVLLNQRVVDKSSDWNVGEFFILSKFQGKGVGRYVAQAIWDQHPGIWECPVIPENQSALAFWHKTIGHYTQNQYQFATKLARPGQDQPYRVIFTFDTRLHTEKSASSYNPKITGLNHITLAVTDIDRSFAFYQNVMGFQPLVKWNRGAYFLVNDVWFCLNVDEKPPVNVGCTHYAFTVASEQFALFTERLLKFGITPFKDNNSEGESYYFLDPDGHKLEIHVGNWQSRIQSKHQDHGSWKQVEWFTN